MDFKLLCLVFFCCIVSFGFAGGDGSVEDPFQISYSYDFNKIKDNLDSNFILVNNIYFSKFSTWEPIGNLTDPFTGTFDGNGYFIKNFYIDSISVPSFKELERGVSLDSYGSRDVGLFGSSYGAVFSNINLTKVNISGNGNIGSLVGNARFSTISDCSIDGEISGVFNVGGLVGHSHMSNISFCETDVIVSGQKFVGGLVGNLDQGSHISNSSVSGDVYGSYGAGGLVGSSELSLFYFHPVVSSISSSSVSSDIYGSYGVGGLVGFGSGHKLTKDKSVFRGEIYVLDSDRLFESSPHREFLEEIARAFGKLIKNGFNEVTGEATIDIK